MYLKHRKEMEDSGVDVGKSFPNTNPSALQLEFKELSDFIRGNFSTGMMQGAIFTPQLESWPTLDKYRQF